MYFKNRKTTSLRLHAKNRRQKIYYYNKETKSNKYTYIELHKFLFEAAYQSIPFYQK
ncbi:Uncharacterised protein [Staphylococcus warneri]|nr:Uncharacterised protein [Staphylococcus warneri]